MGDIHRFPSPKHLASYAGLVPSLHQSGQRAKTGRITKAGTSELRWLMVQAAWSAVRVDPHWQPVYQRLRQRRGNGVAIVAVARKLLVVVWFLLHDHALYHHLRPQHFVRKLQDWAWLVGKAHLPHPTSADFVRSQLQTLGLQEIALSLTTSSKGKLKYVSASST